MSIKTWKSVLHKLNFPMHIVLPCLFPHHSALSFLSRNYFFILGEELLWLATAMDCGGYKLLCKSTHACPICNTTVHVFCGIPLFKESYRQPVICPFCLNAELQVEIKNQVEDQVRAEIKDQVRVQILQIETDGFQNVDNVDNIDTYVKKIQQWTLDNKSS
jgi:hypothetical protein